MMFPNKVEHRMNNGVEGVHALIQLALAQAQTDGLRVLWYASYRYDNPDLALLLVEKETTKMYMVKRSFALIGFPYIGTRVYKEQAADCLFDSIGQAWDHLQREAAKAYKEHEAAADKIAQQTGEMTDIARLLRKMAREPGKIALDQA